MKEKLNNLKKHLQDIDSLYKMQFLLFWDQRTYMPPGGHPARARHTALLARLEHQMWTDLTLGRLLDDLTPYAESLPYDSDDAALIRVARLEYDQRIKVPPSFIEESNEFFTTGFALWTKAREDNDFSIVRPFLERNIELTRQKADYFPGYEHIADPLITMGLLGLSNHGLTATTFRTLFGQLRAELVPLFKAIRESPPIDASCLYQYYPKNKQFAFARKVITDFGFDFNRGRMDETAHPFAVPVSIGDIRLTTRANEQHLGDGIFSTFHEAGHAMYDQGYPLSQDGSFLANAISLGVHESQSRLWENIIGRSRGFWDHYYPQLQKHFADQLNGVSMEDFFRAVNRVKGTEIRVQADEITYNLHIMIRTDLSYDLIEGKLAVKDLPEAWNARYESDLGITPVDLAHGVLQDVHWFMVQIIGAFESYTLGNILSAQYYAAALDTHPELPAQIEQGNFTTLSTWLKDNVWCQGRKYDTIELTRRITGGEITIEPLIRYLKTKYSELYELKT